MRYVCEKKILMMHQFIELNDGTQIVHSDALFDEQGKEYVKI